MHTRTIKLIAIPLLVFGLVSESYAVLPGPYVGMQFGMSQTKLKSGTSKSAPGGGFVIGGTANKYFSAEGFYTHFANAAGEEAVSCGSAVIHTDGLGFAAKGTLPVQSFGVYAKGGVAVIRSSGGGSCAPGGGKTNTSLRPVIGIGVSYELTQNWVADLSYTQMTMNGNVQSTSLIALGMTYHIVDTFCGQFLC